MSIALIALLLAQGTETYNDEKHGLSVTYPSAMVFQNKESGTGWHLFCYKKEEVSDFNANLNLHAKVQTIEIKDTKDFGDKNMDHLKTNFAEFRLCIPPMPVKVNGKEFYKLLYSAEYDKKSFLILQYFYYDPANKMGYVFTALDLLSKDLSNISKLEQVILTIKFK